MRLCIEPSHFCWHCSLAWDLFFPRWRSDVRRTICLPVAEKMEHTNAPWPGQENPSLSTMVNPTLPQFARSHHTHRILRIRHGHSVCPRVGLLPLPLSRPSLRTVTKKQSQPRLSSPEIQSAALPSFLPELFRFEFQLIESGLCIVVLCLRANERCLLNLQWTRRLSLQPTVEG